MNLPFFKRLAAGSSAEISDLSTRNETLLGEATSAVAMLEAERLEMLPSAADDRLDAVEVRLATAKRTVDRLLARREALAVDLEKAKAREAANDLTARRAAVEARAEAARVWLRDTYPRLARELVAGFEETKAATRAVRYVNDSLESSQRFTEMLGPVEVSFDPDPVSYPPSVAAYTQLIAIPAINAPGYNGDDWAFERL